MIVFDRVSVAYGKKTALQNFSLALNVPKTHALIGPSGSGKSTVLKSLIGLVPLKSGSITVDNIFLTPATQRDFALKMGFVPQHGGLFPHMTVFENMSLKARLLGMRKEWISFRVRELLDTMDLDPNLQNKYPRTLSGGQQQRISLGRALFLEPRLILMDEPLGALDPITRRNLQDELKKLFAYLKKYVIFVTHDMSEAAYIADSISIIKDGRCIQTGSAHELVASPADDFVAEFIRAQRSQGF